MGQKVNPNGFRLGISKKQNANWYAKGKDFPNNLIEDLKVREHLATKLKNSSISKIELERTADAFIVNIHTARPGIIIGKKEEADDYVMYKAYNGCLFPLQMNDVEEIYVKDPNVKIEGNKKERVIKTTVFFKEPEHETKFPVFLQSRLTGDNIVVHYAKDNYKKERFIASKKYQYAFKTGDWGFE